uniref:Protein three rows n=1 Tax=Drosophila virilis TaxID=7244 RepID=THR_DROVI|nr:RecName: Full=Protein three rows [Drosophila virilis]AAQ72555.1 three rows [Drosophila virilis]
MSLGDVKEQLRGSRTEAKNAAKLIQVQFERVRNGGTTSVALRALKYELNILRQLCCALQENFHQHADIYCDIAADMLPHVAPHLPQPDYWVNHLMSLQYIHHALCREQTIKQCQRFYELINAQSCQMQNKSEYKYYIDIHIRHVYFFGHQLGKQSAASEAKAQLCQALQALGKLLENMLQLKAEQNEGYSELMGELNQLLGKRSIGYLKNLASLPLTAMNRLWKPLFKLIACNGGTTDQLNAQFSEYLSALLALLQLDDNVWQLQQSEAQAQTPLSLQLLHSCRELYKNQTAQNNVLQLLYNYLKLLNTQSADLKRSYIDLAKKFVHFFEHKAVSHVQEQWYLDFLFVLVRVQKHLHQIDNKVPSLERFWQCLGGQDSATAYAAHFELLQCLTSRVMKIGRGSPLAASCSGNDASCPSVLKHCVFTLGCCATVAYSSWQPEAQATLPKASQLCLASIIHYAIDVAKVTKCLTPNSSELVTFAWYLINMAEKVTTATQMYLLEHLLKPLQELRPLLSPPYAQQLVRRLFKASAHSSNPELSALLHGAYIVSMSCPARQFQQLCVFYHTPKNDTEQCLLELCEKSPLCSPLNATEKRKLYELDMLAVLANKKTPKLLQSLLRHCQTDYQMVLLGRQMRTDKRSAGQQIEELRVRLQRLGRKQQLTRLQQLILGHATVTKLLEAAETQKIKIHIKEMTEKTLEVLLVKYKLFDLTISSEMPLLELATTAIGAFESFYEQADAEPLSSDEALIDWEALIDDGIAAAMALSTMGYIPQADNAWLLLLRICRLLGDRFNYLRALSHFLPRYTQHALFDLPAEVSHAEQLLDELWPQLHAAHLLKRHHTTVLLCLCNLALYYARLDCVRHAQLLLLHAQRLRLEFEERAGKCDIIQLTIQTVRFRMCYQQRHCRSLARLPTALQQLDTLTESVRSFTCISSMDNGALILLLGDMVRDTTECTANRLSELPNFSNSLLQLLLQSGLVLRAVELLISWLWTNLRMECLDKAHSKLRLIEHFLGMQPLLESRAALEQTSNKGSLTLAPMDAQSKHMTELVGKMLVMQLEQSGACVEPIRKQQQLTMSSPRRELPLPSARPKLQRYVSLDMQQSHPMLRSSVQLQCIYFMAGCLHARLYFLNREHEQLDDFYALANAWLQQNAARGNALGHMLLVLHIYQANYLRARRRQQQAIELTETALKLAGSEQLQQRIDVNYRYNLLLQLRTAQLELEPPSKPQNPRRALTFNISPEEKLPRPVRKVATASKKPAKFAIYTEDVRPASSTTSSSSSSSSSENASSPERKSTKSKSPKRLDLNACQLIDIIDLSDDETEAVVQLQPAKSTSALSTRSTRTRAQRQPDTLVAPLRRTATAPNPLSAEATPKTIGTRARARRQNTAEQPTTTTTATPKVDSVSSRRRHRN